MQRIVGVVLGWMLLFGFASEALADRPLTVRGVMAAYRGYLASVRNVSFQTHLSERFGHERAFRDRESQEWKLDLVGQRSWNGCLLDENGVPESCYWEELKTREREISLSSDAKTMRAQSVTDYLMSRGKAARQEFPRAISPDAWNDCAFSEISLGYLDASAGVAKERIGDLLAGSLTVKWQTGQPVVLTSQTPERRLTLWLAPSKGWMPERIEYRLLAPAAKAMQLTRLSYTVQAAGRVGGIWFPSMFTVEETIAGGKMQMPDGFVQREETVFADGAETTVAMIEINEGIKGAIEEVAGMSRVARVELTEVRFNVLSDADFQFNATIPEGTEVGMQDDMVHEYVWQDGRPVLVVPKPPLFTSFFGRQPPELEITDARGVPKSIQLAELRGKWVVLDFCALTCGNCISESLPEAAKFYREHEADRERFEILAVCARNGDVHSIEDFERQAAAIIEQDWNGQPLPFPVLIDGDLKTFDAYGVEVMPETLLIDPQGNLVEGGDLKMLAEKLAMPKR